MKKIHLVLIAGTVALVVAGTVVIWSIVEFGRQVGQVAQTIDRNEIEKELKERLPALSSTRAQHCWNATRFLLDPQRWLNVAPQENLKLIKDACMGPTTPTDRGVT